MCPQESDKSFIEKAKPRLKRAAAYLKLAKIEWIVILSVIVFDLLTKRLIQTFMQEEQSVALIPNFLYFTFVYNDKAAFGSAFGLEKVLGLGGVRIMFLIITAIALGFFLVFLYKFKRGHILARLSFALIIAGAFGNFWDRLFIGEVRDFVEIVYFGLDLPLLGKSFAIFNMADVALTVGVVIFAVYFIFLYKPGKTDFVGPVPVSAETETETTAAAESDTEKETEKESGSRSGKVAEPQDSSLPQEVDSE